ncbi:MAG: dihydrodipicolinate reductase [Nitrososphaeria archaeon]|nr:dihydrodipicolinate reductase [Nitrososphaeria archaeon]MDW7986567.1 dihydrodipicolinate reductase [Nitrososphaerota archaeon]
MGKVKFAVYGIGPIGSLLARYGLERNWMELVAAFDIDPLKIGRDIGEVIGLREKIGIIVEKDAREGLKKTRPDIVLHATGSYLDKIYKQIMDAVEIGADVISTCETLSYPYYRYPSLSQKLDDEAKKNDSTILGTGVNPGFLLDLLPAVMSSPCLKVEKIIARRILDASKRRESFRKKIGLGLEKSVFDEKIKNGELTAHVGYAESICLIADAIRLRLDSVEEHQEALIAEQKIEMNEIKVELGRVRGVRGYGLGLKDGKEVIKIEFIAALGVDEEFEEIVIEGIPKIVWRNSYGTPGDQATVAMVLNYVPIVIESEPGLKIITQLRPPSYCFNYIGKSD